MLFQVRNSRDDAKGISNISRSKGRNEYIFCETNYGFILLVFAYREHKIFYSITNEKKKTLLRIKIISKILLYKESKYIHYQNFFV